MFGVRARVSRLLDRSRFVISKSRVLKEAYLKFLISQRRQRPDPRPLRLLVGTPDGRSIAYLGGCLYIFLIYCFITLDGCVFMLWPLCFGWLMVLDLYNEVYL